MDQRGSIPGTAKDFYIATDSMPYLSPLPYSTVHWVTGFIPRLMGDYGLILVRGRVLYFATPQSLFKGYEGFFSRGQCSQDMPGVKMASSRICI